MNNVRPKTFISKNYSRLPPELGSCIVINFDNDNKLTYICREQNLSKEGEGEINFLVEWEIILKDPEFHYPQPILFLIEEGEADNFEEFVEYMKEKFPDDLNWILFHPEIFNGNYYDH